MPIQTNVRRPLILASVMAATFMIAVEATIVSTAMPQIAGQLGDLHLYAWVFSAFLLTQTATTVVFGKLADIFGRKPILLIGIFIFLLGSLLCGFATSMPGLIAFRLIQGVGGGAIQPVSLTIIGDLYPARERGKIQGWLASVWGISSVLGPLAGGLIINHLSWAWVFWVNLPVGIAAAIGFGLYLREDVARQTQPIDVPGAVLFTLAVAALMVALTELGTASSLAIPAFAVCLVSGALFVWQERRFPAPMLAIGLWTRRPIATANLATLLAGMTIIGLTTFLPMYVQGVLGRTALVAGFALTSMVLGWPIGATFATRVFPRVGLRGTLLAGGALMPVGAAVFILLSPGSNPLFASPSSPASAPSSSAWASACSPPRPSSSSRIASTGPSAAPQPPPTCSPATWAAPWAPPCWAPCSTSASPAAPRPCMPTRCANCSIAHPAPWPTRRSKSPSPTRYTSHSGLCW